MEINFNNARTRLCVDYKTISGMEIPDELSLYFEMYRDVFVDTIDSLGFKNDADYESLLTIMNQYDGAGDFASENDDKAELSAFGLIVFDRIIRAMVEKSDPFLMFLMHEDLFYCFKFSHVDFYAEGIRLERIRVLSKNGEAGGKGKHRRHSELRAWALENTNDRMPKTRNAAVQLVKKLPPHLANVSTDPERFIYEVLRKA